MDSIRIDKSSRIHSHMIIINTLATAVAIITTITTTTLYYRSIPLYIIYIKDIHKHSYTTDHLVGPQTFDHRRGFFRKTNRFQSQTALNSNNPFN